MATRELRKSRIKASVSSEKGLKGLQVRILPPSLRFDHVSGSETSASDKHGDSRERPAPFGVKLKRYSMYKLIEEYPGCPFILGFTYTVEDIMQEDYSIKSEEDIQTFPHIFEKVEASSLAPFPKIPKPL